MMTVKMKLGVVFKKKKNQVSLFVENSNTWFSGKNTYLKLIFLFKSQIQMSQSTIMPKNLHKIKMNENVSCGEILM